MPNWNHIVRQHLAVLRLPPEREIEIVEELALMARARVRIFASMRCRRLFVAGQVEQIGREAGGLISCRRHD
jgi:hypothetical protein